MKFAIIIALIILSGLFSGLNLGLLSLNKDELLRKIKLGNKNAKTVYPIRKQGNLLLTTLLLGNVAVNAALSIFLADISTGLIGGVISTIIIVIFGEILPQSYTSRYALKIGAKTAWITRFMIILFFPIAKPIAFILDKALGEELPTIWSKEEIKEIIKNHEDSPKSLIDQDEERIIIGALSFSNKKAYEVMTPRTVVFALEENTKLNDVLIKKINTKRHTRIPIYRDNIDNIVGIVLTKDLLWIKKSTTLKSLVHKDRFIKVLETEHLDNILNLLISKRIHMACIFDEFGAFTGIVTLEDIIEEILQKEVYDEDEKIIDPRQLALKKGQQIIKEK